MEQDSLFSIQEDTRPLADRMRPETLDEYVGQKQLVAKGNLLWQMIEHDQVTSMIFWGPPGVGKTTLARIIAHQTKSYFVDFSAVTSGIKEIKEVMKQADTRRALGQKTILFVDEIHRFNKAQQDAFLPYVEKGSIILIGATTENPSFEINSALLSRCRVFVLNSLNTDDLKDLIIRAISSSKGLGNLKIHITDEDIEAIAAFSGGDARFCLNTLEMVVYNSPSELDGIHVSQDILKQCLQKRSLLYDKKGEEHYNIISALHKSVRNSDVQAAVYWLARMLEAGEDPLYIARRFVRMASEDIGMADSRALEICVAAYQACHYLGVPECNVHLTHAAVYLALAPKSNALEVAYNNAKSDALKTLDQPVPLHIRNAPTKLMKDLGYSKGYEYSHDYEYHMTDMQCLPDALVGKEYYVPSDQGSEVKVRNRLAQIKQIKAMVHRNRMMKQNPKGGKIVKLHELMNELQYGESIEVECKKASNSLPKSVWETYSSFANTNGGTIYLGVDESKNNHFEIVGVDCPEKIIKDFWDTISSDKVSSNILLEKDVRKECIDGKSVVIIHVPRADYKHRPVYINGNPMKGTYKRNYEGDYHCTESEIKSFFRDASDEGNDGTLLSGYTMEDIDGDTLQMYRNAFEVHNPNHVWNSLDNKNFLRSLGGYAVNRGTKKEEGLTLAGLLMFWERSLYTGKIREFSL